MRTHLEILSRIEERREIDTFGFEISQYICALPKKLVEPFRGTLLKEEVDLTGWKTQFVTDDDVLEACRDYIEFAWEKANDSRGLSAWRSMAKYTAWLWLLGKDDDFPDLLKYEAYGKPHLRLISEFLGVDADEYDDGERRDSEPDYDDRSKRDK